jgi:two-component system cell cycle response regulator
MALRVLLADESTNIKKVMQLALQDFGVEVKAVPVGLDVLSVAQSFKPNIVFADVLLSKRSGYDVCDDLKKDNLLKSIPVVLMWSGFMELDEAKFKSCKANDRLEKPFDAETLRSLVKKYVPSVKDNEISNYLSFPKLPDIIPGPDEAIAKGKGDSKNSPAASMDLEDPEDFQQVPLPKNKKSQKPAVREARDSESESWSSTDLSKVKINPLPDDVELSEMLNGDISSNSIMLSSGAEEVPVSSVKPSARPVSKNEDRPRKSEQGFADMSSYIQTEKIEEIMREEIHRVIRDIAWKIIPNIAERVIQDEIDRLMQEDDHAP